MRLSKFRLTAAVIGLTLVPGLLSDPAFAAKHSVVIKDVSPSVQKAQKAGQTSNNYSPTIKWTLDKKHAKVGRLTKVEQENFEKFQNAIATQGKSPKDAAALIGNSNYKKLRGSKDKYEIHLSQGTRATFLVHNKDHVVKILKVGGHTQQMNPSAYSR